MISLMDVASMTSATYNTPPQGSPGVPRNDANAADAQQAKVPLKFLRVTGSVDFSCVNSVGSRYGGRVRRLLGCYN